MFIFTKEILNEKLNFFAVGVAKFKKSFVKLILVINSQNLEPGVFPDENGHVPDDKDKDEPTSMDDLLYDQTVQHLKEKGLAPSEEIEVWTQWSTTVKIWQIS